METVSNVATQAASKLWGGESDHREPISGAQGDVSRGEPYDAGNMDVQDQKRLAEATTANDQDHSTEHGSNPSQVHRKQDEIPESLDSHRENGAHHESTGADDEGASKVGVPGEGAPKEEAPKEKAKEGAPKEKAKEEAPKEEASKEEAPEEKAKEEAPKEKAPEDGVPEEGDPETSVMGDGPKPLDVVARENGGDAGNRSSSDASTREDDDAHGGEEGSKGTGELYVKTTGFAADGGDFDATKPGAAKEADRLMDEKGEGRGGGEAGAEGGAEHDKGPARDKPSLGERIKNKLHKK